MEKAKELDNGYLIPGNYKEEGFSYKKEKYKENAFITIIFIRIKLKLRSIEYENLEE